MKRIKASEIEPVNVRIKTSKVYKGIGLFSARPLTKGTVIFDPMNIDKHFLLPYSEFHKLDIITQNELLNYCAQYEEGMVVTKDINYFPRQYHMNHSCDPNVGCDDDNRFVVIKDVDINEELCFDYAFVVSKSSYTLKCVCKTSLCRKVITGDDWKNKEYAKKNLQYFSYQQRENFKKIIGSE
jgi:SET domain-containing protein